MYIMLCFPPRQPCTLAEHDDDNFTEREQQNRDRTLGKALVHCSGFRLSGWKQAAPLLIKIRSEKVKAPHHKEANVCLQRGR